MLPEILELMIVWAAGALVLTLVLGLLWAIEKLIGLMDVC